MSYLVLVPSEHSSGGRRRQGSITKTGNNHVVGVALFTSVYILLVL
jgi:transposase